MLFLSDVDHNKTLSQLYGDVSLDNMGLTRKEYYACKAIYNNYTSVWQGDIEPYHIEWFGFNCIEDMRIAFMKSKIYNDIRRFPDVPLQTYVQWCTCGRGDEVCLKLKMSDTLDIKNIGGFVVTIGLINILDMLDTTQLLALGI